MPFKVTLTSHEYTLIAKGINDVFVVDLKHEQWIQCRLSFMQRKQIAVHLGNIDLIYPWYHYGCLRVIHMLLMAFGGIQVGQLGDITTKDLWVQVRSFPKRLAWYGILLGDLGDRSMLCINERSTVNQRAGALHAITPIRSKLRSSMWQSEIS